MTLMCLAQGNSAPGHYGRLRCISCNRATGADTHCIFEIALRAGCMAIWREPTGQSLNACLLEVALRARCMAIWRDPPVFCNLHSSCNLKMQLGGWAGQAEVPSGAGDAGEAS